MKIPTIRIAQISEPFISMFTPKSRKSLNERSFFKLFWIVIRFLGLQPYKLTWIQTYRAILICCICCIPNTLSMFVGVFTTENDDDKVHGIQVIPVLALMIFDATNFMRKAKKIEEFCGKFDVIIDRFNDENFCVTKFRAADLYFIMTAATLIFSLTSNLIVFALTGSSGIPSVKFESFFGFLGIFVAQATIVIYTGTIFLFLDAFMCSLLFLLSGYSEHLGNKFRTMKIENVEEIIDLHLEFRNLVVSYEEIFSTVIMLRGLLNTLALSSIVLEIVVKGSSEMTFNILFFGFNGLFKLFIPCYYGSYIEFESGKFIDNLYDISWLEGTLSQKKDLLLLMKNFQEPLKVNAMKIVDINLETLLTILQWTYSMYTALYTLRN